MQILHTLSTKESLNLLLGVAQLDTSFPQNRIWKELVEGLAGTILKTMMLLTLTSLVTNPADTF